MANPICFDYFRLNVRRLDFRDLDLPLFLPPRVLDLQLADLDLDLRFRDFAFPPETIPLDSNTFVGKFVPLTTASLLKMRVLLLL